MTATQQKIPRNKPLPYARGTVIPCNDNYRVEIIDGNRAFISTTERTVAFTEVLAAKFYVDAYHDQMAALNGLKPIGAK